MKAFAHSVLQPSEGWLICSKASLFMQMKWDYSTLVEILNEQYQAATKEMNKLCAKSVLLVQIYNPALSKPNCGEKNN